MHAHYARQPAQERRHELPFAREIAADEAGRLAALASKAIRLEIAAQNRLQSVFGINGFGAEAVAHDVRITMGNDRDVARRERRGLATDGDVAAALGDQVELDDVASRRGDVLAKLRGGWHEHDHQLFHGIARFFRPAYSGNLVQHWLPALDGVEAGLRAGIRVADVGCGHGLSTIIMAQAFPKSQFVGFDNHPASIAAATEAAREAGVDDRCRFEVASAKDYPGKNRAGMVYLAAAHRMNVGADWCRQVDAVVEVPAVLIDARAEGRVHLVWARAIP